MQLNILGLLRVDHTQENGINEEKLSPFLTSFSAFQNKNIELKTQLWLGVWYNVDDIQETSRRFCVGPREIVIDGLTVHIIDMYNHGTALNRKILLDYVSSYAESIGRESKNLIWFVDPPDDIIVPNRIVDDLKDDYDSYLFDAAVYGTNSVSVYNTLDSRVLWRSVIDLIVIKEILRNAPPGVQAGEDSVPAIALGKYYRRLYISKVLYVYNESCSHCSHRGALYTIEQLYTQIGNFAAVLQWSKQLGVFNCVDDIVYHGTDILSSIKDKNHKIDKLWFFLDNFDESDIRAAINFIASNPNRNSLAIQLLDSLTFYNGVKYGKKTYFK